MHDQQNCCGTTCDKQKVAEYIAELERRAIPTPKTTHQLCDAIHTTRLLLDELVELSPEHNHIMDNIAGGWMSPEYFKETHEDEPL
ncbi:hypothetical protein [Vibrio phage LP.1]|nr:hypothetical protein [Vibrio phage LP.1]